jgi:predicted AlkP superfamily pyrophosphatase or phosphodiesterase
VSAITAGQRKLVLLLADGLRADTARDMMGSLQAHHEAGRAHWSSLRSELPSVSRPLYATVITGKAPLEHGITSNLQVGESCGHTVFETLAAHGRRSAVAGYHWFYELLAGTAFDPLRHRQAALPQRGVVAGSWYFEDDYPDSHLLADAEQLRLAHTPDLLLVHPMGPDHAGHQHGGDSAAYVFSARKLDMLLARLLPRWHAAGYDLLLTSDHGMNADRMHGGALAVERDVPLVWLPHDAQRLTQGPALPDSQLDLAGFVLAQLLGQAS